MHFCAGCRPVSYTHLDVYKRQLQGFPYNQMNHYVKKITSCYARYQRIYAES